MKYIVVGGVGYLGSHLVDLLLQENHQIVVFDNFSGNLTKGSADSRVTYVLGDITIPGDIKRLETFGKIDGIFHLAARKSVSESIREPQYYENVNHLGTRNMITFCKDNSINNFVYTSSAAVYGEVESKSQITEDVAVQPINPYGRSKHLGEVALTESLTINDLSAAVLRIFNIVGSTQRDFYDPKGENVLPIMINALKHESLFTVNGGNFPTKDGTCVRDYVNVADVANAHKLAMEYLHSQPKGTHLVSNICSGVGTSVLELISIINDLSPKKLRYRIGESRPGDPSSVIGEFSTANRLLGWQPGIRIEQSVMESINSID